MPEENSSRLAAKANKLYWQTSRPAGRLADELGISRSKFYALIEPLRLEVKCEVCGSSLAFSSRSDREVGRGHCPGCGAVAEIPADAVEYVPAKPARLPSPDASLRQWLILPGNRQLWLSAIVGVATGLLATSWWRRR
jgi:hypothetical protein